MNDEILDSSGHLYALINPSMPGLVKVGMTSRSPEERAAELGSTTGVPAPFAVAFDVPVANARQAEREVHRRLADLGYRVGRDREFFSAPLKLVIKLMTEVGAAYADVAKTKPRPELLSAHIVTALVSTVVGDAVQTLGGAAVDAGSPLYPRAIEAEVFFMLLSGVRDALNDARVPFDARHEIEREVVDQSLSAILGRWAEEVIEAARSEYRDRLDYLDAFVAEMSEEIEGPLEKRRCVAKSVLLAKVLAPTHAGELTGRAMELLRDWPLTVQTILGDLGIR